jgi:membrane fusion protein (multidrug efflux system)
VRYVVAIVGLLALAGALAAVKVSQIKQLIGFGEAMALAGPPPEVIGTAKASSTTWEKTLSAVGTVTPEQGVTVSNEASGVVSAIRFESGARVKKGQILLELDSNVERAQLASIVAKRNLAKVSVERSRALVGQNVLPKAELDAAESDLKSSSADAAALQAQIDKKIVRAPFDGRLGIRQVNLGQYLNPGTAITVLQAVDSVYVDFTVPQTELAQLTVGMPTRVQLGAETYEATVAAIDPTLDPVTRAVKLRAAVTKPGDALRPGMFVNVSVVLPDKQDVVMIPATAVVHASFGDSVFIVEQKQDDKGAVQNGPDGKPLLVARQQFVKIGAARGDFVAIAEGVKAGAEVVSAGAFKLRNGSGVVVNSSVDPKPQLDPKPENR